MPENDLGPLMPHQSPMLLVDRVIVADEDGGETEALFTAGGPFVLQDGRVDEAVHFELMAQSFAACAAVRKARSGDGTGPEAGYLTTLRSLAIHGTARVESPLRILVKAAGRVGDFIVVDGQVFQDGGLLASGQVTLFIPGGSAP